MIAEKLVFCNVQPDSPIHKEDQQWDTYTDTFRIGSLQAFTRAIPSLTSSPSKCLETRLHASGEHITSPDNHNKELLTLDIFVINTFGVILECVYIPATAWCSPWNAWIRGCPVARYSTRSKTPPTWMMEIGPTPDKDETYKRWDNILIMSIKTSGITTHQFRV